MKRPSFLIQLIALALAVLLPAESAHCAWMMSPVAKAPNLMRADHACCRAASPSPAGSAAPRGTAPDCACLSLPQAAGIVAPASLTAPEVAQTIADTEAMAPPALVANASSGESDVSPPRAPDVPAHPLRGPPTRS